MADGQELKNYKESMQTALETQFPEMNVLVFKKISEDFTLPAIVVNLPVLEPNKQTQSLKGKLRTTIQTNAFVVYSATDDENEIECLQKSANISNFINGNTFGQMFPAIVTLDEPMIVDGLEEFIFQRIDFEQDILIVENR